MRRIRYSPKTLYEMACIPFTSAEEAWFWFIRCQRVRREGARQIEGCENAPRPCDPDDLYRAVMWLFRRRRIGPEHLKVLGVFGMRETPPDPRCREEERSACLWDVALDQLTTVLKRKGIVECEGRAGGVRQGP